MDANYLDCSGSMKGTFIETIRTPGVPMFYFNTRVYNERPEQMSGGTDFKAVYKHALENKFKIIAIFTDEYGNKSDIPNELTVKWIEI